MSLAKVLPIAKDLAASAEGFSNGEFAKAAGLTAGAAGAYIASYVKAGHVFRGAPEGRHGRYFDTEARADDYRRANEKTLPLGGAASHEAVARLASAQLRNQVFGSRRLAELCKAEPGFVDDALAPLVDAGKLTRVSAFRNGAAEYDYRWSATWVPCEADFARCQGGGEAPKPSVSPVAPAAAPQPANDAPGASPRMSPAPKPPAPAIGSGYDPARKLDRALTSQERSNQGRSGAASQAKGRDLDRAFSQAAQSLGWTSSPAPAPAEAPEPNGEDRMESPVPTGALQIDVVDLVCAINSRGELALDLGDEVLIKFKPRHALVLTRFLAGNSQLEQMDARGEL